MTWAIFITLSFLGCDVCLGLVPEVSQEGLLRPYVSYSDVTLLHYHLPQQLATATWEFAAFMDDPGCPVRVVHVLLQHGSYPLVSPHNDTFAPYMYDKRSSLHKVSTVTGYRPHDATLLALDSPLPGSWYAAAYIPHWDQQMQQEGLIHKCRYSLGSIAMWRQQDGVHTLHPGPPTEVTTRRNLEYFRFYVPSHTWLLKVSVNSCKKMEGGAEPAEGGRWCLRWAGLRARALPKYDLQGPGAANVSSGGGHVFREERPYTDSYYYLLLYTEGQTRATVTITTKECGGAFKNPHSRMLRSTDSVSQQHQTEQPVTGPPLPDQQDHTLPPSLNDTSLKRVKSKLLSPLPSTAKPIRNSPSHAINISEHQLKMHESATSTSAQAVGPSITDQGSPVSLPIGQLLVSPPAELVRQLNASHDIQSSDLLKSANNLNKSLTYTTNRHENVIKNLEDIKEITAVALNRTNEESFVRKDTNITKDERGNRSSSNISFPQRSDSEESEQTSFDEEGVYSGEGSRGYSHGEAVKVSSVLRVQATVAVFHDNASINCDNLTTSNSSCGEDRESTIADFDDFSSSVMLPSDGLWSAEAFNSASLEEVVEEDFVCYPVLPLARIKHAMDFTDTFLIQGPEWYSTWVSVRADSPVFTHLTLLPHTDIGGTLTIALHLDPLLQNATHQLVTVEGCARKGRAPPLSPASASSPSRLSCPPHLSLQATSLVPPRPEGEDGDGWWGEEGDDAAFRSAKNMLLVPFPEPDEWYLGLMVVCYSAGSRTPCALSEVVVSVEARTQPCLFAGALPCGPHGTCQETHKGLMAYSSCKCAGGWRGWGCQQRSASPGYSLSSVLLLTLSNGFFLPAIVVALRYHLPSHALLYAATMLASILYHLCDNQVVSYCVTRYEVLQFTDFFFSLMCFWVTVVGLATPSSHHSKHSHSSPDTGRCSACGGVRCTNDVAASVVCDSVASSGGVWHTLGVVVIAPCVQYSRTALASFAIPMALAATVPVGRLVWRWWCGGGWPRVRRRQLLWRGAGALLALTGLSMFALVQTKANYKFVHSFWHSTIALSLLFLLPTPRTQCQKHLCRCSASQELGPFLAQLPPLLTTRGIQHQGRPSSLSAAEMQHSEGNFQSNAPELSYPRYFPFSSSSSLSQSPSNLFPRNFPAVFASPSDHDPARYSTFSVGNAGTSGSPSVSFLGKLFGKSSSREAASSSRLPVRDPPGEGASSIHLLSLTDEDAELLDAGSNHGIDYTIGGVDVSALRDQHDDVNLILLDVA